MFVVDTNLLVYAANRREPEYRKARDFLEACRSGHKSWAATWSIFYEFLRVATHAGILPQPLNLNDAWSFLQALLDSPFFHVLGETERHGDVVRDLARRFPTVHGNDVHDLHIVAVMVEHGVREIRTADAGFHRFKFLNVMDPLAP
ncbi:MAG TPA: TA system VapC family ribonuclease toxin [Terriglobales bacterium]|nr:TA system VapC family ribonuclease toxin [Terriglobales bacterium]